MTSGGGLENPDRRKFLRGARDIAMGAIASGITFKTLEVTSPKKDKVASGADAPRMKEGNAVPEKEDRENIILDAEIGFLLSLGAAEINAIDKSQDGADLMKLLDERLAKADNFSPEIKREVGRRMDGWFARFKIRDQNFTAESLEQEIKDRIKFLEERKDDVRKRLSANTPA